MTGRDPKRRAAAKATAGALESAEAASSEAPPPISDLADLRSRAEERARALAPQHPPALSPDETLQELRVHQIELEMQNEELRRAQLALEDSRARYFDLYDLAPVGYCTLDAEELILEANLTAATLLGVARGALAKQPLTRFILPADQDIYYHHRRALLATGAAQTCELRLLRPDGPPIWANLEATIAQDDKGATVSRVVVSDITARKRGEEAMRESEERYRTLFEDNHAVMLVIDPESGAIVDANPAACAWYGWSREEMLAMRIEQINVLSPAAVRAEMKSARAKRRKIFYFKHRRADGTIRDVEVFSGPIELRGTTLLCSLVYDVTGRKQAEALALSAAQLREQLHETVRAMGAIVGLRDPYTAAHERRVTVLAAAIAVELGLDEEAREGLAFAGEVHDIGKIAVPAEILSKPGALNVEEFALIKRHPEVGLELLGAIHFRQPVAEIVGQHHERMDGSGYPEGLKGDEIMLEARIIAVADVVEAMASHRPYRQTLGIDAALAEVRGGAGTRYDAEVVAACERVIAAGFVLDPPD